MRYYTLVGSKDFKINANNSEKAFRAIQGLIDQAPPPQWMDRLQVIRQAKSLEELLIAAGWRVFFDADRNVVLIDFPTPESWYLPFEILAPFVEPGGSIICNEYYYEGECESTWEFDGKTVKYHCR
jgi:hypothetical protein